MKTAGSALTALLRKNKYVLLVLALGLVLLMLPSGNRGHTETYASVVTTGDALTLLLSDIEGVGEVKALISEFGAVVVCDGAGNAQTRLNVINAVSSYTGLGSDRISVIQRK